MAARDDADRVEVRTRAALRAWLEKHHGQSESVWVVSWKKGRPDHMSYDAIVEELLCWGWIDTQGRALDAERTMLLVSPRRAGSAWSSSNKARVERLRAAGAMTEAGEAEIRAAEASGMWTFLDDVERLEVPADLGAALDGAGLRAVWDGWPRGLRRATLEWIKTAKRTETRAARIAEVVGSAGQGLRPKPFR
jgi:uncharacterized protein YdeI (YjbR/CyaY-like superfamily)